MTRFLAEQLSTAHWFDQRRTRERAAVDACGVTRRGFAARRATPPHEARRQLHSRVGQLGAAQWPSREGWQSGRLHSP